LVFTQLLPCNPTCLYAISLTWLAAKGKKEKKKKKEKRQRVWSSA